MKRYLFIIGILMFFCTTSVRAELSIGDTFEKIPAIKQGIGYSVADSKIDYLATVKVMGWKGIALEAGYNSSDKAVAVLSYELLSLKKIGIDVPILDLLTVNVGYYVGFGRIQLLEGQGEGNNEFTHGPSLTLLEIKW